MLRWITHVVESDGLATYLGQELGNWPTARMRAGHAALDNTLDGTPAAATEGEVK